MSHTPPVPAGNQSPFPLQEPPHAHGAQTPAPAKAKPAQSLGQNLAGKTGVSGKALGIGAAVGVGLGAILAGLFFAGGSSAAKPKSRAKAKPHKAAKSDD